MDTNSLLENRHISESDQSPSLNNWDFHVWKPLPEAKPIKEHQKHISFFLFQVLTEPTFQRSENHRTNFAQNTHYLNFHNTTKQATSHMHYTNANTTSMLSIKIQSNINVNKWVQTLKNSLIK